MHYLVRKLLPKVGFRRVRTGRNVGKRKQIIFMYKLYNHNLRWKSLLFSRICLNSPFYQRKAKIVSVNEVYKALLQSFKAKGPIVKCLYVYYRLIHKKTPYDKGKKKKKKKKNFFLLWFFWNI